eukprot:TRINITY_DN2764_c0_g1_i1.p1 TRINITY_DN2764_c0_g1~~TRINITY_DN2764_c0_g1_i1.p1  ORF type:complete len:478 (-),score=139.27 TRINITY_DN2764_c0_g1_i1:332-1765(-)
MNFDTDDDCIIIDDSPNERFNDINRQVDLTNGKMKRAPLITQNFVTNDILSIKRPSKLRTSKISSQVSRLEKFQSEPPKFTQPTLRENNNFFAIALPSFEEIFSLDKESFEKVESIESNFPDLNTEEECKESILKNSPSMFSTPPNDIFERNENRNVDSFKNPLTFQSPSKGTPAEEEYRERQRKIGKNVDCVRVEIFYSNPDLCGLSAKQIKILKEFHEVICESLNAKDIDFLVNDSCYPTLKDHCIQTMVFSYRLEGLQCLGKAKRQMFASEKFCIFFILPSFIDHFINNFTFLNDEIIDSIIISPGLLTFTKKQVGLNSSHVNISYYEQLQVLAMSKGYILIPTKNTFDASKFFMNFTVNYAQKPFRANFDDMKEFEGFLVDRMYKKKELKDLCAQNAADEGLTGFLLNQRFFSKEFVQFITNKFPSFVSLWNFIQRHDQCSTMDIENFFGKKYGKQSLKLFQFFLAEKGNESL